MRLFFALWPDGELVRRFEAAANLLALDPKRLVSAKNLHLTLAFVGEVAEQKLAVLQHIGQAVRAPRFTAVLESLEYWAKPRAVVAAVRNASASLLELATKLQAASELPQNPLHAHVTLARKVAQAPVLPAMSPIFWRATHFSLVRSQTGGAESAYTVVDTWPLLYES